MPRFGVKITIAVKYLPAMSAEHHCKHLLYYSATILLIQIYSCVHIQSPLEQKIRNI